MYSTLKCLLLWITTEMEYKIVFLFVCLFLFTNYGRQKFHSQRASFGLAVHHTGLSSIAGAVCHSKL